MARYQENPHRKKMWFGTQHHSEWIDCPLRNADMSPEGWGTEGTYLSGGGFSRQSKDSHRNYIFEWGSASSRQAAERMQAYRDGVYNKYDFDLVYFQDPLMYSRNVLPKRWSQPGIVTDQSKEVHSPLGRVRAIDSPPGILGLGVPMVGARVKSQSLVAFNELEHPKPRSVWVPIPEGETLTIIAWTAGDTGSNGLYARTLDGTAQKCGLLPVTFSGVPGVLLGTVGEFDFFGARAVFGVGDQWRDSVEYRWTGIPGFGGLAERVTKNGTTTNLFTNPGFTNVSQTPITVWENLIPNPSFENDLSGLTLGSATSVALSTFEPAIAYGSYAMTISIAEGASAGQGYVQQRFDVSGKAGMWIGFSVLARRSGNGPTHVRMYSSWSGSSNLEFMSPLVELSPADMTDQERIIGSIQIPEGATEARVWLRVYDEGGSAPRSGNIHTDGWLACIMGSQEAAEKAAETYFDSTFSPDPDLNPTTRPFGGGSRLTGKKVNGVDATGGVVIQSTQWSKEGQYSARFINNVESNTVSYASVAGMGDAETVLLYRYQDKTLPDPSAYSQYIGGAYFPGSPTNISPLAPNSPGEYLIRFEREGGNTSPYLRVWGAWEIGESVWFDLLTLTETEGYDGPPFSGDTAQEGPEWLVGSGNSGCRFIGNPTWSATSGVNGGQIGYAATLKEVGDWQQ